MNQIFEDPLLLIVLAGMTAVILGFAWLQTGRKQFVYGMGIVIAMIVAVVIIERAVVTDREAIDAVLHEAARAVERNDLQRVLQFVHPEAPSIRAQAEAEFPKYRFESVDVKQNLKITFDDPDEPTEATAKFNVVVVLSYRDGTKELLRIPRFVVVTFRKDGENWRAWSYEHHEAQMGLFDKKSDGQ